MENKNYFAVAGMDPTGNAGVFGFHEESSEAFTQATYANTNGGCAKIYITKSKELTPEILKDIDQMIQKFIALQHEEEAESTEQKDSSKIELTEQKD